MTREFGAEVLPSARNGYDKNNLDLVRTFQDILKFSKGHGDWRRSNLSVILDHSETHFSLGQKMKHGFLPTMHCKRACMQFQQPVLQAP